MRYRMFSKAHLKALKPSIQNNFTLKHPLNTARVQFIAHNTGRQLRQKLMPRQGGLHQAATEHVRTRCDSLSPWKRQKHILFCLTNADAARQPRTDYVSDKPEWRTVGSFPAATFQMNSMSKQEIHLKHIKEKLCKPKHFTTSLKTLGSQNVNVHGNDNKNTPRRSFSRPTESCESRAGKNSKTY